MKYHVCSITFARKDYLELIHRAEAGETIIVTRYGRPVARLVPYDPKRITA
jgi:prevent-host-death family protein